MTSPPITVRPHQSLAEAARIMSERQINRLPVVKNDTLVGIVTRADLVRAFARPDKDVEHELRVDVLERTLWLDRDTVEIDVVHGNVKLAGSLPKRSDAVLLESLAARVPGVIAVESALTWEVDDTTRRDRRELGRAGT
jgi:CBS domain-containing protein